MTDNDATQTRQDDAIEDAIDEILRALDAEVTNDNIKYDVYSDLHDMVSEIPTLAATLGAGTCHYSPDDVGFVWWDDNDVEHYEEYSASDECCSASCDKCDYTMMVGEEGWFDGWDEITEWWEEDGSYHRGYVLTPRFKFCPNCGAKVVTA